MSTDGVESPESLTSLDAAFDLPANVCEDPALRGLYEVLVARMRKEASGLVMGTVMELLIERIAFNYVILRTRERHPVGSKEGFSNAAQLKDFNTFWLTMTKEFNAMVTRGNRGDREATLSEVKDIILKTVSTIPDPKVKSDLIEKFSKAFDDSLI